MRQDFLVDFISFSSIVYISNNILHFQLSLSFYLITGLQHKKISCDFFACLAVLHPKILFRLFPAVKLVSELNLWQLRKTVFENFLLIFCVRPDVFNRV